MPEIGEIRNASKIGKKGSERFIWLACIECGKERWVETRSSRLHGERCLPCSSRYNWRSGSLKRWNLARENNPMWKGGRCNMGDGYIQVRVETNDFFFPMSHAKKGGYVPEHRLVMAKHLGRCLHSWEIVHHKNGIRDDNRIENLELQNRFDHIQAHSKGYSDGYKKGLIDAHEKRIRILEQRVTQLESENILLQSQLAKDGAI